ncbi:MAG TPA: hypothetical protein VFS19_01820 [Planctomycetota bacterium]|nr:hypothetical protein [Planctomycetota bacterium]
MKGVRFKLLERCKTCGIGFVIGTFIDHKEIEAKRGLKNMFEGKGDIAAADGVWMGDLIDARSTKCPRCGAPIAEPVEVEVPDKCGLCEKEPMVQWLISDTLYVGLCHSCAATRAGVDWVEQQRRKHTD